MYSESFNIKYIPVSYILAEMETVWRHKLSTVILKIMFPPHALKSELPTLYFHKIPQRQHAKKGKTGTLKCSVKTLHLIEVQ